MTFIKNWMIGGDHELFLRKKVQKNLLPQKTLLKELKKNLLILIRKIDLLVQV